MSIIFVMDLKQLQNQTILFFGKPRAFDEVELDAQLQYHKIKRVSHYEEGVAMIVEGRIMSPYEQNESEALYEQKVAPFISVDLLERALVDELNEDTLLMGLKLSRNKERLLSFIKNTMISDTLFFRLLKMYQWGGEDFLQNDSNRDVSAALIRRFYKNIERNHNVEYATLGLMHLVSQTHSAELIEVIFELEPLQTKLQEQKLDAKLSIFEAIVRNTASPKSVLKRLIQKAPLDLLVLIAMREDQDLQEILYAKDEEQIYEALSLADRLDVKIINNFLERNESKYLQNIAKHTELTPVIFESLAGYEKYLGANRSLDDQMQKKLLALKNEEVTLQIASHSALSKELFFELLKREEKELNQALFANPSAPKEILEEGFTQSMYHFSLASNSATPPEILYKLAQSNESRVLKALAQNEATPIEVLYQLQLDSHLQKYVKENPSFGAHIQSQNIGWILEGDL